jgi:hypothetical protein
MVLLISRKVPPGAVAEERAEARTGAEELVRRYIVNNAKDGKAVRFVRWGPHMTGKELVALYEEGVLDVSRSVSCEVAVMTKLEFWLVAGSFGGQGFFHRVLHLPIEPTPGLVIAFAPDEDFLHRGWRLVKEWPAPQEPHNTLGLGPRWLVECRGES